MAYRGPASPDFGRELRGTRGATDGVHGSAHDDDLLGYRKITQATQYDIRDAAEAEKAKIFADPRLTEQGRKEKWMKETVPKFLREAEVLRPALQAGWERVKEIRKKCVAPREIDGTLSVGEQIRQANAENRAILRLESLDPSARRAAVRRAMETGETNLIRSALAEPGLIDASTATMAEKYLMRSADRFSFKELEELIGEVDASGEHNPLRGGLTVAQHSYDTLVRWLNSEAGGAVPDLQVTDGQVVLTVEQAKDPNTYRSARELAQAKGASIVIENGDGGPGSGSGDQG